MFKNSFNRIWMVLCLVAMFAAVSCGSGSPLDLEDEALDSQDTTLQQLEPVVVEAPAITKGSSDWVEIDPGIHEHIYDILYHLRHIDVESGVNVIDPLDYLIASDNVVEEAAAVDLNSGGSDASFVTYGLRDFPEGEDISRLVIRGYSDAPLFNPGEGVYIGVHDFANDQVRWFGPFGTDDEYVLNLWNMDTVSDDDRAYFTVAVYGGDTYTIEEIEVTVGNLFIVPEFHWEMWDPSDFLDPHGYIEEGEIHPPVPPIKEIIPAI